jgi:hypothetical protein
MTRTTVILLRPCPNVSAQWLEVVEPEQGSTSYTLYQAGYGPGVRALALTCAQAIELGEAMGVG